MGSGTNRGTEASSLFFLGLSVLDNLGSVEAIISGVLSLGVFCGSIRVAKVVVPACG